MHEKIQYFISQAGFLCSKWWHINENLVEHFSQEVQITKAGWFYSFQITMENIYSEMYSLLIDTYIKDSKERDFFSMPLRPCLLPRRRQTGPCVGSRTKRASMEKVLWLLLQLERIFFSGSFALLFWLNKWGLMSGLTFSTELISRDKGLHCNSSCQTPATQTFQTVSKRNNHQCC